jgi:hypothetical protein
MKHFSERDWADFVRGVAPPESTPALEGHLGSGCKKCLKSVAIWRSILEIARDEAGPPPPESAIRGAKACFGLYSPQERTSRVPTLADLIFDSFLQPLPAGARSSVTLGRQLLYESEGTNVDIHTQFDADSSRVSLTGQVLDPTDPNADMKDISVMAMDKRGALAQTVTNASGEFHLECDHVENVWLKVKLGTERTFIILIRDLESR